MAPDAGETHLNPGPSRPAFQDLVVAKSWLLARRMRQKIQQIPNQGRLRQQKAEVQAHYQAHHQESAACFVFAPGLSWSRQLFQRPQQLALALGRQGGLVYYLEPEPQTGLPVLEETGPRAWRVNAPPEALSGIPSPFLYLLPWSDSPAGCLSSPRLVYDIVDDFAAFKINQRLLRYQHEQRMREAECVLVTARRLAEWVLPQRKDAVLSPNAVDYAHFHRSNLLVPGALEPLLAAGRPIVGYYGALAAWFDYPLLAELASMRPDLQFVLIGPAHDGSLAASGILQLANICHLGPAAYSDLPAYLQAFDAAMIPFRVNEITNATSPIKLFEYMAGGKAVVSTSIAECVNFPGVLTAAGAAEFSAKIDLALAKKDDPDYLEQIDLTARRNTWDARAAELLAHLRL